MPHLASSLAPALDFVFPPVCGVESHLNARSRLVDRCSRPTMDMFPALLTIMKLTQLASLGRKGTTFCPNTFPGATLVIGCWDQGKDSASQFLFGAASLRTANVRFTHPLLSLSPAIKCPRLRKPNYGDIYPSKCSTKKSAFGDQCAFACKKV